MANVQYWLFRRTGHGGRLLRLLMGFLSAVLKNSAGLYAQRAAGSALSFGRLANHSDGRVAVQEPWTCRPAWATAKRCTCKLHILKCLASTKERGALHSRFPLPKEAALIEQPTSTIAATCRPSNATGGNCPWLPSAHETAYSLSQDRLDYTLIA
jgi:hypothetical protein